MKTFKWYKYLFTDGTVIIVRGMSAGELRAEETKHGKLLMKTFAGEY